MKKIMVVSAFFVTFNGAAFGQMPKDFKWPKKDAPLVSMVSVPVSKATLSCDQGFNPRSGLPYSNMWLEVDGEEISAPFGSGSFAIVECRQVLAEVLREAEEAGGELEAQRTTATHKSCGGKFAPDSCFTYTTTSYLLLDRAGRPFKQLDPFY
jgi:hypothetical protein